MSGRDRAWPGAFNARDVGGIPLDVDARGASRSRPTVLTAGRLFRSGRTASFTEDGWRAVHRDGVRTVVDLRPEPEHARRADDPALGPRALEGLRFVTTPIEDPDNEDYRALCDPYLNHPRDYGVYATLFADRIATALEAIADGLDAPPANARPSNATAAASPVSDGTLPDAGRTDLERDDEPRGAGVLVNCSAGRDRTGLICALVLRASGASNDAIATEDELATRAVNAHHGTRTTPHPYERHLGDDALAEVIASRRDAVTEWLAGLDAGDGVARALEESGAFHAAARVSDLLGVCSADVAGSRAQ